MNTKIAIEMDFVAACQYLACQLSWQLVGLDQ